MTDPLDPDLLVKGDFILLRTALVDALGGNFEAAIVLQRIAWRCERDGSWVASREVIQEETRLSEWKVKAAIKKLKALGWLTSERSSTWDATPRWRVITEQEDSSQSRAVENLPLDREDSSSSGVLRVGGFLPPDEEIAEILTPDREESSRSEEEESSRSSLQTEETSPTAVVGEEGEAPAPPPREPLRLLERRWNPDEPYIRMALETCPLVDLRSLLSRYILDRVEKGRACDSAEWYRWATADQQRAKERQAERDTRSTYSSLYGVAE